MLFSGSLRSYDPVTLTSDRAGLVMDRGAKVKLRGVQIGRVGQVTGSQNQVNLELEIEPGPDEVHPGQRRGPHPRRHLVQRQVRRAGLPERPEPATAGRRAR